MKMKIMLMLALMLMIVTACSKPEQPPIEQELQPGADTDSGSELVVYGLAGYIKELTANPNETITILVEGELGKNGADYHRGNVTVNSETVIYAEDEKTMDALEKGQYVHVFFAGDVMESDPIQATARQINIVPEPATQLDEEITEE